MDNAFLPRLKEFIGRNKYWIVLALFLLVIVVASENSLVKRVAQKRKIHELQEQLYNLQEQNENMLKDLNNLNNDTMIIEHIARERYYMHRSDEDLFLEK